MIVTADEGLTIDWAPMTEVDEIIQNVRTILRTAQFSVPLERRLGISGAFIDSPMTDNEEAMLREEIFNVIKMYEPRAVVTEITFEREPLTGVLKPRIEVDIVKGGIR